MDMMQMDILFLFLLANVKKLKIVMNPNGLIIVQNVIIILFGNLLMDKLIMENALVLKTLIVYLQNRLIIYLNVNYVNKDTL